MHVCNIEPDHVVQNNEFSRFFSKEGSSSFILVYISSLQYLELEVIAFSYPFCWFYLTV